MFAFGIGEELEEFGDTYTDSVVSGACVRVIGLVLAVLGRTEFLLVRLLFLALDGILFIDRSEKQIQRFADKGLTGCRRSSDTSEERERLLLTIQLLEADTSSERAEDRKRGNDHRRLIVRR